MKIIRIIILALFLLVILGCLVTYIAYVSVNMETRPMNETARKEADGRFVVLGDGITHYESGGPDTGKTVILVHGFSVPYYIWGGTFDSLVRSGFHVVRYDEFGRGYSDRPELAYNPALYRKQLFDLIHALQLKTPVSLVAVSFGGAVVSDFAVHYPGLVDKIVLVDPVFHLRKPPGPAFFANIGMVFKHEEQATSQLEDFAHPDRFPGWVDRYKVQMHYKGFRYALISTLLNYPQDSILANYRELGALHKNILLIWGREDHTVPFTFSDSLRPLLQPDFLPVEDAGHLPFLEQAGTVCKRMISFLRS